jgi:hypothetical protein
MDMPTAAHNDLNDGSVRNRAELHQDQDDWIRDIGFEGVDPHPAKARKRFG